MKHMKKQTIFLVPATLLMIALVPTLPAFASNSNDEGSDDEGSGNAGDDVSCSPVTGNPYQEKCGETTTNCNDVIGCTVTAPEATELNTPRIPINVG
jgi:hypothetical protein